MIFRNLMDEPGHVEFDREWTMRAPEVVEFAVSQQSGWDKATGRPSKKNVNGRLVARSPKSRLVHYELDDYFEPKEGCYRARKVRVDGAKPKDGEEQD